MCVHKSNCSAQLYWSVQASDLNVKWMSERLKLDKVFFLNKCMQCTQLSICSSVIISTYWYWFYFSFAMFWPVAWWAAVWTFCFHFLCVHFMRQRHDQHPYSDQQFELKLRRRRRRNMCVCVCFAISVLGNWTRGKISENFSRVSIATESHRHTHTHLHCVAKHLWHNRPQWHTSNNS